MPIYPMLHIFKQVIDEMAVRRFVPIAPASAQNPFKTDKPKGPLKDTCYNRQKNFEDKVEVLQNLKEAKNNCSEFSFSKNSNIDDTLEVLDLPGEPYPGGKIKAIIDCCCNSADVRADLEYVTGKPAITDLFPLMSEKGQALYLQLHPVIESAQPVVKAVLQSGLV